MRRFTPATGGCQEKTARRRVFREAVSDASHQQPEVAKKKRHDAVFFVKPLATLHTSNRRLPRKNGTTPCFS
jgi:hypothetical protein